MTRMTSSEVGMAKKSDQGTDSELRFGRRVSREVSVLLTEIEKEPVPDRLLDLAQQLQKALSDKLANEN
ncbi:hypothetical protein [Pseudorhizobium xiangyangii]|uniref:hypothetical protein n=1 Tax=Pseudorhizobium xiangyangii TaxID=2883104 RepID=UPI001CFFFB61|nr:hypothetical protein [Neorhizobium xiangyangii]